MTISYGQEEGQYLWEADSDPPTHFLLLCLRARFDPGILAEAHLYAEREKLDWDSVESRIAQDSLASLIYPIVHGHDLLPLKLEKQLHLAYIQRVTCSTFLFHELEQVIKSMTAAGIDVILLKGAALARTVYHPTLPRYFNDLDLMVRRDDRNRALSLLAELGYKPLLDDQLGAQDLLPYLNEQQLSKSGHLDVEIDLHWHLFNWIYYQHTVDLAWFWQTALPITIASSSAKMLGPEAQLLHLCVHVLQHLGEAWNRSLRRLHDIAEVILHYQEQIDWELLLAKTEAFNLVLPVRQTLLQVVAGWQVPIPPTILEQLREMRPSPDEERAFARLKSLVGGSDARYALVGLIDLPNWRSRLHYLHRNLLFPSIAYMRYRYNIQRPFLLPLYYPYRWYLGVISALQN